VLNPFIDLLSAKFLFFSWIWVGGLRVLLEGEWNVFSQADEVALLIVHYNNYYTIIVG
jgi:hypothetical protein